MTKEDNIKDSSYMVLHNLAFQFVKQQSDRCIRVINLKNIKQESIFKIRDSKSILYVKSNMSEANKYKSMALVERNKIILIKGYLEWENIQKKE